VTIDLVDSEDEVGRVCARSRSVAAGYVPEESVPGGDVAAAAPAAGRPDAGNAELAPGRFLTADLGIRDDRGRLHLVGRVHDVINVGARKVYPAEVERVIRGVAGVRDVVVLSLSRSAVADALRAIVVADGSVDRASIIAACERSLARHKVPRLIEFRSELPRTARGKLDRGAL
jgi:acyl-CoA synthetase (AMP-forming)/AMP-acid ligase II